MTTLHNILQQHTQTKFATDTGTQMHRRLQRIFIGDTNNTTCDADIITRISANPDLRRLFDTQSQTEVPIAGTTENRFISRRLDRLRTDHTTKTIEILDYKTDINPDTFRTKYIAQLHEYATLLRRIYPQYKIICYILWTHDFSLEKIN